MPASLFQVIINRGDTGGTLMYIVQLGEVEVLDDWHLPPLKLLKEGDTFGEVGQCHHGGFQFSDLLAFSCRGICSSILKVGRLCVLELTVKC